MKFPPFMRSILIFCSIMLVGLSSCAPTADTAVPLDNPTLLANLIKTSNSEISGFDVTVDNSDPSGPRLRIATGLANNIAGDPVRITIDIDQSQGITTVPENFTVVATKFIEPHEVISNLMVTFGAEDPVSYTVITAIGGAPVNNWFAVNDNLGKYISATFVGQGGMFSIAGTTLSIAGFTNSPTGEGEITFTLPEGFTAEPSRIILPNPGGTGETTSKPDPSSFTITETGNTENSMAYTIADVPLAALTRFTGGLHIKITEGDGSTPGNDITDTLAITDSVRTEDGSNVIRIEGLRNKAGLNAYTLTIAEVADLFTTPGNAPITRTIAEPNGARGELDFSPGTDGAITDPMDSPAPTFALTNSGESEATIYTLEVVFSGAPVSDWFTRSKIGTYITEVFFAGADANMITFDGTTIAISGDSNFANEPDEKALFNINFPRGFDLNTSAIMSPLGDDGFAAVTDASSGTITISETGNPNNSETYSVTITLAAYNSPLTGNITATYGGMTATSIAIETTNITIIGFTNDDTGTPEMGAVMIAEAMIRTGYTATPLSLEIMDPPGKALTNLELGMITVTNARTMREIPHSVTVRFDGDIQLRIEGTEITGSPLENVDSGTTIAITTGACELLAAPTVTIVSFTGGRIADATPFPLYYDRERDTLDSMTSKRTVARRLTLEDVAADGSTNVLTANFVISVTFPECTSFAAGTGDSATPYEIDNAPRLDLMSHLVSSDRSTYGDKEYKLTANINMGLPGFPRSEVGSKHPHEMGATGEGFYPLGIGTVIDNSFSGTLDCASNTISGLYIDRRTNGVGLVGNALNATIKNCGLTDVNITAGADTGGLVGYASNSTISNSSVTGSVTEVDIPFVVNTNAGGLVGFLGHSSSISDSYADVTLSGEGANVGGLVGTVFRSAITNSYAIANVTGMSDIVGGLVGTIYTSSSITDSYALGSVTGVGSNIGGLAGGVSSAAFIKDSYANVNVTGMSANVGGLVGSNSATITNAYATGNVSGTGDNVGLFIGLNADGTTVAVSTGVTNSYFSTDAILTVGGTVQSDKKGVGSDDAAASPPVMTANLIAQTTIQLQSATSYTGWETSIWQFTPNDQYPRLINVVCANRQFVSPVPTACMGL